MINMTQKNKKKSFHVEEKSSKLQYTVQCIEVKKGTKRGKPTHISLEIQRDPFHHMKGLCSIL